jgi:hypothetical protein
MVGARRARRHWWIFWTSLCLLAVLFVLYLTDTLTGSTAAELFALVAGMMVLVHLCIDFINPNANLDANHALASQREKDGELWLPYENKPEPKGEAIPTGVTAAHGVFYVLMAVGVLAFLMPVVLHLVRGMKSNSGWHPEVVGPGEKAYIWFPQKIDCVKGLWSGQPRVTLLNGGELELPGPLPVFGATAKNDTWANTISVKSSEKNSHPTLWAYVQLPDVPALAGKTLKLCIDMDVSYPQTMGGNQWMQKQERHSHTASLIVSPSGAGSLFVSSWWLGFLAGTGSLLLCGALLAVQSRAFRKKALPTRIFTPEPPAGADEEQEDDQTERRASEDDRDRDEDDRPRRRSQEDDRDREDERRYRR